MYIRERSIQPLLLLLLLRVQRTLVAINPIQSRFNGQMKCQY